MVTNFKLRTPFSDKQSIYCRCQEFVIGDNLRRCIYENVFVPNSEKFSLLISYFNIGSFSNIPSTFQPIKNHATIFVANFIANGKFNQSSIFKELRHNYQGWGVKNEPQIEKCYVLPPANEGEFSSEPPT